MAELNKGAYITNTEEKSRKNYIDDIFKSALKKSKTIISEKDEATIEEDNNIKSKIIDLYYNQNISKDEINNFKENVEEERGKVNLVDSSKMKNEEDVSAIIIGKNNIQTNDLSSNNEIKLNPDILSNRSGQYFNPNSERNEQNNYKSVDFFKETKQELGNNLKENNNINENGNPNGSEQ